MNNADREILERLIEYNEKRLTKLENQQNSQATKIGELKECMGEVRGEMRWVKLLMGSSVLLLLGQFLLNLFN
jgi:hypothetical protein